MAGLLDKETQSLSGVNCLIPHETQLSIRMLHVGPKKILKIFLSDTSRPDQAVRFSGLFRYQPSQSPQRPQLITASVKWAFKSALGYQICTV